MIITFMLFQHFDRNINRYQLIVYTRATYNVLVQQFDLKNKRNTTVGFRNGSEVCETHRTWLRRTDCWRFADVIEISCSQ